MCRTLKRFASARNGNVAMTFGLALVPIVGSVGAAIDFSHANDVKAAMQASVDATALMISRDAATTSSTDLQTKADNYFKALFVRPEARNVAVTATYSATAGSQVVVRATAEFPTSFVAILGYETVNLEAASTAKWGSERLRVALALDVTGSMASDGKMAALKEATKALLQQLKDAAASNGDVYVSIVPFNKDVNVGNTNYTMNWINWDYWRTRNGTCTGYNSQWRPRSQWSCQNNGGTWTSANPDTWNGCLMDRDQNYDQTVEVPAGTSTAYPSKLWPAEQFSDCPAQMTGLTYDWTALNGVVDSLSPVGNTNQGIGLVWAWQSLVGGGPLTAPAEESNYTYRHIVILMSDGMNTENRYSGSQNDIDKRMYDSGNNGAGTCANAKATAVTIYSVQVNTGGDPTSTVMQNCASSSDKFWEIKSADDLGSVFNAIGTQITKLRVAQ